MNTASGWPPVSTEGPYDDLESLIRVTHKDCARVAFRILGRHADAEDAMQNAYVRLTLNWPLVRSFATARQQCAYLLRVVANEALQIIRVRGRGPGPIDAELAESLHSPDSVAEQVEAREDLRSVWQKIGALPEACQAVVALYTAGFAYGEIATMLGVHVSTVRSHMSNARRQLRPATPDAGKGEWQ